LDGFWATGAIFALMAAVILAFRIFFRRPRGVAPEDPPGVRTVAVFRGDDEEFFRDDRPEAMLVGNRLFDALLEGLAARQVGVENRGRLQNAQRAECVVAGERFALVLERVEDRWAASVEWVPQTRAEARHLAWTHQVFAPPDSPALRRLLSGLDDWLKSHARIFKVEWHRKEKWFADDATSAAAEPLAAGR